MLEEQNMSKSRRDTSRDDQTLVQGILLEVIGSANTTVKREAGKTILTLLKVKRYSIGVTQATGGNVT